MYIIDILQSDPIARAAMDSGDTLFDPALGITELLAAWPNLVKRVTKI
jgi:hypothetical protein